MIREVSAMPVPVAAITDRAMAKAMSLAHPVPPSALAPEPMAVLAFARSLAGDTTPCSPHLGQGVEDRHEGDGVDSSLARVLAPVLDLLVHIHRAVPEGEGVYRDEQARREAAVTADPAKAEPAPGDREGASTVAEPGQEPRYREDDQDQVLNGGHPDLGASGYPDADDRDSEHDQAQRRVDADTGPGVSRAGSEYGQHGRAEDDNLGHGADHVTRDHQPPGQEP